MKKKNNKRVGYTKISHKGNVYYFNRTVADYDEYVSTYGERVLVDESGKVTHSTIADIEAWREEKP